MAVPASRFREIMASFPTGVAVVTALAGQERPHGMTSNAICSVSADPGRLLVCVGKASRTLQAILNSGAFAVNFLAAGTEETARWFAGKAPDKFAGVRYDAGRCAAGAPILTESIIASAECVVRGAIDAGDHWIFIGEVEDGRAVSGKAPLLLFRRVYT